MKLQGWRLYIIICSLAAVAERCEQPAALSALLNIVIKNAAQALLEEMEKNLFICVHLERNELEKHHRETFAGLRDDLIHSQTGFESLVDLTVDFMRSSRLRLDKLRALAMIRCKSRIDLCTRAASAGEKLD